MSTPSDIQSTVFKAPSGGISAILTGFMPYRGKSRRVAHAYVFVDKAPTVQASTPTQMTLAELAQYTDVLQRFGAELVKLNDSYGFPGA